MYSSSADEDIHTIQRSLCRDDCVYDSRPQVNLALYAPALANLRVKHLDQYLRMQLGQRMRSSRSAFEVVSTVDTTAVAEVPSFLHQS